MITRIFHRNSISLSIKNIFAQENKFKRSGINHNVIKDLKRGRMTKKSKKYFVEVKDMEAAANSAQSK